MTTIQEYGILCLMLKKELQPEKVRKINCPKCGELQVKVYPWSNLTIGPGVTIPPCKKCLNKLIKSGLAR